MGFLNGIYTPPDGAEDAVPGEVIRSATWNTIFTDLSANGLSVLGGRAWVTNPPRTVASGSFTVLTTDVAVYVTGSSPTITVPASTLISSPFMLIGDAGSVFAGANAVVLATGTDKLSGAGTLTLASNYMVATFYPIKTGGGYVVTYANPPGGVVVANTVVSVENLLLTSPAGFGVRIIPTGGNGVAVNTNGLLPLTDNYETFGGSGNRWANIYGVTVTISGPILSNFPAGIGYATGAGGTVVQATNKTTGVTLATSCGQITMSNATLAAATIVSFSLTNSIVAATDVLILNHISGGTPGSYGLNAQCGAGSATINVRNNTAGALAEAIVLQFADIKAVNS